MDVGGANEGDSGGCGAGNPGVGGTDRFAELELQSDNEIPTTLELPQEESPADQSDTSTDSTSNKSLSSPSTVRRSARQWKMPNYFVWEDR